MMRRFLEFIENLKEFRKKWQKELRDFIEKTRSFFIQHIFLYKLSNNLTKS